LRLGFADSTSPEGYVAKPKQPSRAESLAAEHLRGVRLLADLARGLASLDDPEDLQEQTLVLGQPSTDGWHGHPTLGDHETVRITWLRKGAWPCHPAIHPFRLDRALEYALRMFRCSSGAVCPRDSETGRVRLGPAIGRGKALDPEHLLTQDPVRVSVLRDHRLLVLPESALTLGASLAESTATPRSRP